MGKRLQHLLYPPGLCKTTSGRRALSMSTPQQGRNFYWVIDTVKFQANSDLILQARHKILPCMRKS
jgi:hypothetical protein